MKAHSRPFQFSSACLPESRQIQGILAYPSSASLWATQTFGGRPQFRGQGLREGSLSRRSNSSSGSTLDVCARGSMRSLLSREPASNAGASRGSGSRSCLRSRWRESATNSALSGLEIGVIETTDAGVDVRLTSPASCRDAARCHSLCRRHERHGAAGRASPSTRPDEHRRTNPIRRFGRRCDVCRPDDCVRRRADRHRMALSIG
jgi:hypothetical protein